MHEKQKTNQPSLEARDFAIRVARLAVDLRAEDIVVLDLRDLSPVTDFFVICSGTSDRQMRALYDALGTDGKSCGWAPFGSAGHDSTTWMLLDFVDVVVHIFSPEYRQYYDLELLWGDAPRVEWSSPGASP
jgi:ribosome-associated protein